MTTPQNGMESEAESNPEPNGLGLGGAPGSGFGLCRDCKWWQIPEETKKFDRILTPEDPDTYEPMELAFAVRQCCNPSLLFCERPLERNQACVADASEYYARLCTGPDFGCTRYEA